MKSNQQLLSEITATMADTWLSACDRRVIVRALLADGFLVIDRQGNVPLFGPAHGDECQLFVHRAAARDVLQVVGTFAPEATAAAARVAVNGHATGA